MFKKKTISYSQPLAVICVIRGFFFCRVSVGAASAAHSIADISLPLVHLKEHLPLFESTKGADRMN